MAVVTSAVIAGVGVAASISESRKSRSAARRAADLQAGASEESLAQQQQQFGIQQEQLAPRREAGLRALDRQQAFTGLLGPEAQQQAFDQFASSPGQQFLQEQGLRLLGTSSGVTGAGGGERLRELTRFGQGLASQEFGTLFNRLGGISGAGQAATAQGLGLGAQNIAGQTTTRQQQAEAQASGILGAQQARTQGFRGVLEQLPGLAGSIGGAFRGTPPPATTPPAGLL